MRQFHRPFHWPVLACALLLAASSAASARMYQWVDAQTGTVQLSGSPPSWYRGAAPGPRVFVFENGRLIDDTARTLPAEQAALLRATAFGQPLPVPPVFEAPVLSAAPALPAPPLAATPPSPEDSTSRQIAEFKALLEAYDRGQEAAAQERLGTSANPASP